MLVKNTSITAHAAWILMPVRLLKRQQCKWCVLNRNVNISNKKAQYKDPLLSCLTLETARDQVGYYSKKSHVLSGVQWSENTKGHQARIHTLKGIHFHFTHPVWIYLSTTGIVLYKRCHHYWYKSKQIAFWKHRFPNRNYFHLLGKRTTFILKFCKWNPLPFQRNDILIEPNDIIY